MRVLLRGQEMYLFFGRSGKFGITSLILSCAISGGIIYKSFMFINKENISSYQFFLNKLLKRKKGILINVIDIIVILFLAISYVVMCSGVGAYFNQELGIPNIVGCIILCLACIFIFKNKTEGIVKLNEIAMPILIVLILGAAFLTKGKMDFAMEISHANCIINAVTYASYNSIVLIPILVTLKKFACTKKNIIILSSICSLILITLGLAILYTISSVDEAQKIEIPLLYIAGKISKIFSYLYGVAILLAMLTSAASAGFGFMQNISKNEKNQFKILLILCGISVILGSFGFSNLVKFLYPIFGYLGIIQMFFILTA